MGASAAVHPTNQILRSYGMGKLDDAAFLPVSKHLESCPDCSQRVAVMSSDTVTGRLPDTPMQADLPVPVISSDDGLSTLKAGLRAPASPPAGTLPPGLADHPDYEIVRELGQGGMGTIYLVLNRLMGRYEVLKVVSSHLVKRRGAVDRFLAEIRHAGRLHHPNIVTSYAASRLGATLLFAMEYVDGLDLAKLVEAKGPLPVASACNYIYQAALGLQHAHELSMVHRDIKPSNLMLMHQGSRAVVKVLDFGLAKVRSEGASDRGLTYEGQMLGTPDFIAPEQIGDARQADIRADIYSLGCTLYYLLTGHPPFKASNLYDILQAHHSMDALPLNLARPEVPVELAALVATMMAKEPDRRFQSPDAVAQALKPFFKPGRARHGRPSSELSSHTEEGHASETPATASTSGPGSMPNKPAPVQPDPKVPDFFDAGSEWDGLIDLGTTAPLVDRSRVGAKGRGQNRDRHGRSSSPSRPLALPRWASGPCSRQSQTGGSVRQFRATKNGRPRSRPAGQRL